MIQTHKEGHYSSVCWSKGKNVKVHEVQAQATAAQYKNCNPEECTAVYCNTDVHNIKTAIVKSLNNPRPEPQIRLVWLSKELSSQIYCTDCEVDTGASCNILPLYKVKTLFGENIQPGPPTVKLIGYNNRPIKNLGSIIVFLYHGNEKFKVLCEVADRNGHMILGRDQTSRMKYIDFPQIQEPIVNAKPEKYQGCWKEQVKIGNWSSETSHPPVNGQWFHHKWLGTPAIHHKRIPTERVCRCIWMDRDTPCWKNVTSR